MVPKRLSSQAQKNIVEFLDNRVGKAIRVAQRIAEQPPLSLDSLHSLVPWYTIIRVVSNTPTFT